MPRISSSLSSRQAIARRIDRCYLIAAWTRVAAKRSRYLTLARHYRAVLALTSERAVAFGERLAPA